MERDILLALEKIAYNSYAEWHAGLNAMLNTHEHFARYVDKNYRVKEYKASVLAPSSRRVPPNSSRNPDPILSQYTQNVYRLPVWK